MFQYVIFYIINERQLRYFAEWQKRLILNLYYWHKDGVLLRVGLSIFLLNYVSTKCNLSALALWLLLHFYYWHEDGALLRVRLSIFQLNCIAMTCNLRTLALYSRILVNWLLRIIVGTWLPKNTSKVVICVLLSLWCSMIDIVFFCVIDCQYWFCLLRSYVYFLSSFVEMYGVNEI
jgi:hypothetical protein